MMGYHYVCSRVGRIQYQITRFYEIKFHLFEKLILRGIYLVKEFLTFLFVKSAFSFFYRISRIHLFLFRNKDFTIRKFQFSNKVLRIKDLGFLFCSLSHVICFKKILFLILLKPKDNVLAYLKMG